MTWDAYVQGSCIKGAYIPSLGCYLLLERSGEKVKRTRFSQEKPQACCELALEIVASLEGKRPCPWVDLDMTGLTDFQKEIYAIVREIPRGETRTYGEVAASSGRPKAARAVGHAMACNPFVILVPCHRVIGRHGLGGFASGLALKEKLLDLEKGSF
jgi:methylated-DNA-[protein]-cysteine S-methyltransferase